MVTAAQPATTSTFSPLTTWDGWQQFVDTPHAPARDADDQEWTLEQREDYHARFVVLKTPAMDTISTAVRRLLLLNRGQQGGARRGLIISGPATTGKTTAMQQLGRTVELADRRRRPPTRTGACRCCSSPCRRPPHRRCSSASSPASSACPPWSG